MRLIDDQGNAHDINIEDITCIKREVTARKTLFYTGSQWLHDPNTLVQLGNAYQKFGFYLIDKNKLINLYKVDEFKDGHLWVGGTKYPVSRRLQDEIQGLLNVVLPLPLHER